MQIGFGLDTVSVLSGSGDIAAPAGIAPLSGLLEAENVVVLGASIMDGSFGSPAINAALQPFAAAIGFTGTLVTYSASGDEISNTIARLSTAKTDLAASAGSNLYIVHSGGNNVSNNRPYPGGKAVFQTDYTALMDAIVADGDKVVPLPLTKRFYVEAPLVVEGDDATEANGSLPYNENIIHPAISAYAPGFMVDGAPYANPYAFADRWNDYIGGDGIHGLGKCLAHYILMRVAGRALGLSDGARAGRTLIYSLKNGQPYEYLPGAAYNELTSYSTGANDPVFVGALDTAGLLDPFIEVEAGPFSTSANVTLDDADFRDRLADSRFHDIDMMQSLIGVSGTDVLTLTFTGLYPGDLVTVKVAAQHAFGNTTARVGDVTLNGGETVQVNAGSGALSNQAEFAQIAVPADGKLVLDLAVAPGANYGYLGAVLLDFA
ncbi:hypothetical protein Ga0609869_003604 [Rhodovulum iodosum]|uniref:SGNH/GDSL hydrolase family protein n=1 Tax=Rhodovulum iodosum TaxID=68291 RepID=A0ABV3XXZ8_9RHOB|nr:SGNH/GDSL hydrolase family protein [Rhodovulum robiginosum]RSK38894.1 SGNH/GDSL hydrolase family protein [Rhodovulum robiginosum]